MKRYLLLFLLLTGTAFADSFEYPLPVKTSMGSSDWVRIVSSSGTSSNISFANFLTAIGGGGGSGTITTGTSQSPGLNLSASGSAMVLTGTPVTFSGTANPAQVGINSLIDLSGTGSDGSYSSKAFWVDADGTHGSGVGIGYGATGWDGVSIGAHSNSPWQGTAVGLSAYANGGIAIGQNAYVAGGSGKNGALGNNALVYGDTSSGDTWEIGDGTATMTNALHFHGIVLMDGSGVVYTSGRRTSPSIDLSGTGYNASAAFSIDTTGAYDASFSMGTNANGSGEGIALGYYADGHYLGCSLGTFTNGSNLGVALGFNVDGHGTGNVAIGSGNGDAITGAVIPNGMTYTVELGSGTATLGGGLNFRGHPVMDASGNLLGFATYLTGTAPAATYSGSTGAVTYNNVNNRPNVMIMSGSNYGPINGGPEPTAPCNAGTLVTTGTLNRAYGSFQYSIITTSGTLISPINGVSGAELTVWVNNTSGSTKTLSLDSNILLPSDAGLSLPKTLTAGNMYVVKLWYNGTKWMLISLMGGFPATSITTGGSYTGGAATTIATAPYNAGTTAVTGTFNCINSLFQQSTISTSGTIAAPINGSTGTQLTLWVTSTTTQTIGLASSILVPSESGLILPKTLTANKLYIMKLWYNGTAWMLVSLEGGF